MPPIAAPETVPPMAVSSLPTIENQLNQLTQLTTTSGTTTSTTTTSGG
jgi:hypothetical protein